MLSPSWQTIGCSTLKKSTFSFQCFSNQDLWWAESFDSAWLDGPDNKFTSDKRWNKEDFFFLGLPGLLITLSCPGVGFFVVVRLLMFELALVFFKGFASRKTVKTISWYKTSKSQVITEPLSWMRMTPSWAWPRETVNLKLTLNNMLFIKQIKNGLTRCRTVNRAL